MINFNEIYKSILIPLQTEIFNLTRENKQLAEQIMRLKQQISYMESTIGKNRPPGKKRCFIKRYGI